MGDNWRFYATAGPIFFVLYQALSKLLPKNTSVFLVNACASLCGAVIMIALHMAFSSEKSVQLSSRALLISLAIGVCVSLGNYFIIRGYSLGASQSLFTSIFYPILIGLSVLVGVLVWSEKMSPVQWLGIIFSIVGIVLVGFFRR